MAPVILPPLFPMSIRHAATPVPATPPPHGGRSSSAARRDSRGCCSLPSLAVVALVALYPLGKTVYQSFTDQEFLAPRRRPSGSASRTTGSSWHDTFFRDSIWTTIKFTLITVSFEFVLGLVIALVVNSNFKGRGVMRAVMLVPWAIPTVVAAQMWKWMLDDIFGVVNDLGVRAAHPLALARAGSPTRARRSPRCARSTSGRRRRSSRCCCSPACR